MQYERLLLVPSYFNYFQKHLDSRALETTRGPPFFSFDKNALLSRAPVL